MPSFDESALAPPSPPRRRLFRLILLGLAGFAVSAGALVGCFLWYVSTAYAPPIAALREHQRLVAAGKLREAYDATTARFRRDVDFERFESFAKEHAAPAEVTHRELTQEAAVLTAGGVAYTLIREDGSWKVDRIGF